MTLSEYLLSLKVGDVVIIQDERGFHRDYVTKITPTQIVVRDDRYRRTGSASSLGLLITSNRWSYRGSIMLPTPRVRAIATIRDVRLLLRQDITLTTIPAMRAALDEAEAVLREGEA